MSGSSSSRESRHSGGTRDDSPHLAIENGEEEGPSETPKNLKSEHDIEFVDEAHKNDGKKSEEKSKESGAGGPDFSKIAALASGQRTKKMWHTTGDADAAMWSCGQSAGLIRDVPSCRELMERMGKEAEECLRKAGRARL